MRKISSSDQRGDFRKTAEQIIRFFLIIARIDEARVGYGGNAHLRGLGSSDPGKSVLDDEAAIYGYAEFHRRAQVDVGMRFTVFDFLAGNNGFEKRRQSVPSEKRARGRAQGACGDGKVQVHLPQLLQDRSGRRENAYPVGKEVDRDLPPPLHHFVAGHSEAKRLLVKLDGEPVTHSQHVSVVFAAISNAVFGEQLRVNLVPPRLGVGEDAIQIEDHSAERLRHDVPARQSLVVVCYQLSVDWNRSRNRSE